MIINVGGEFIKNKKLKNEDILLHLDKILTNNINKYYNVFNIENCFKLSRKYFYKNKKDEYIILLNLKDKIIILFNEDHHNEIYIALINLFLYQNNEFDFIEFLIDEINDFKSKYNNFYVMKYSIISEY